MRHLGFIFLFPILAFFLSGCLFESAPTGPSRSNNTWLLGVWEHTTDEGAKRTAVVTPIDSDRVLILFEEKGANGKVLRSGSYEAWISLVGRASLLTVKVTEPNYGYLVLGYQLLDPLNVRLREVTLDTATLRPGSFRLRVAIRKAFQEGTLFGGKDELWKKTGEIYWEEGGDPAQHTFRPPRNPPHQGF